VQAIPLENGRNSLLARVVCPRIADAISSNFAAYGGYIIGTLELLASALILTPKMQFCGAGKPY